MFHHTVRRLKIHSKGIFLVVVFGGIYILGVFLKLLTLPYKVISAGTARHTALKPLSDDINSDRSVYPPRYESVISPTPVSLCWVLSCLEKQPVPRLVFHCHPEGSRGFHRSSQHQYCDTDRSTENLTANGFLYVNPTY